MTTALVTGASGGIGAEMARILARRGETVVLVARSADRLSALAAELGGAEVVMADLSDPAGVAKVTGQVPQVDVLINNAGVGDFGPFSEADLDATLAMIELNVTSLTELTHRYLPGMLARGHGRVINVASTAAFGAGPLMAVYYATKAYVLSFSEALSEELRGTGVTVTALCPGPTASGFWSGTTAGNKLALGRLPSAASVAAYGIRAMDAGRAVAVPGASNKLFVASTRLVPRAVLRRVVKRMQLST